MKKQDEVKVVRAAPVFKAIGGKRQLIAEILPHVPVHFKRYQERFVGGGALFFELYNTGRLPAGGAVLNDANPFMMAVYEALQKDAEAVLRALQPYVRGYTMQPDEALRETFYYERRAKRPDPDDPDDTVKAAAWFLFVTRTGFNGLYRVNKKGEFNVPHGRWASPPTICNTPALRAASAALQGVKLQCGDFDDQHVSRGDFFYFDPPYWPASATSDFTAYTKDPFGPEEQERLRDYAAMLKTAGAHVLLSNADVPPIRKLYAEGFEMRRVEARRNVNSVSTKRGKVGELLIW